MNDKERMLEEQKRQLGILRKETGLSRAKFADMFGIPLRTVEDWEAGKRKMPEYLLRLMTYKIKLEIIHENSAADLNLERSKKISVIHDAEGHKIVMIHDIRFKGKKREEWDEIEVYLKEYVGKCYEIAESAEKIYIGKDFPDEFSHGKDKTILKGPNAKAKANASQAVGELIQIATNKSSAPDYNEKHGDRAKKGWYRYDTRIALPVYNDAGELIRYNIFKLRMLVRHDADGKLYLYDFLRTKKETSSPLE